MKNIKKIKLKPKKNTKKMWSHGNINSELTSESRIKKVIPTIDFLIKNKAKIIVISHVGRPKGKTIADLTLKPIAKKLGNLLNKNITFLSESVGLKIFRSRTSQKW